MCQMTEALDCFCLIIGRLCIVKAFVGHTIFNHYSNKKMARFTCRLFRVGILCTALGLPTTNYNNMPVVIDMDTVQIHFCFRGQRRKVCIEFV